MRCSTVRKGPAAAVLAKMLAHADNVGVAYFWTVPAMIRLSYSLSALGGESALIGPRIGESVLIGKGPAAAVECLRKLAQYIHVYYTHMYIYIYIYIYVSRVPSIRD